MYLMNSVCELLALTVLSVPLSVCIGYPPQNLSMQTQNNSLQLLNDRIDLDFIHLFNNLLLDEQEDNPYINVEINGKFYDTESFVNDPIIRTSPVFISINVQSLNSKHANLSDLVCDLINRGVNIEIIALQEVWSIENPQLLDILGFHPLIFKQRAGMRGGGVGFYIKNSISWEIVEDCSPFQNKIIESLTLLLSFSNNSKMLVTSIYRSNGLLPNVTSTDQLLQFNNLFNDLLAQLSVKNIVSYLFTDSNINLLNNVTTNYSNYLNTIFSNGFLQLNRKATRMQEASSSLIDHIVSNDKKQIFVTGTLISDVSDHFINFVCNGKKPATATQKLKTARIFSPQNLTKFKMQLNSANWNDTFENLDVNEAYGAFWSQYKNFFDETFPLTKMKFNKNIHKANSFMTAGLLTSRGTKTALHKQSLANPTPLAINLYKQFCNTHNRILRAAKILHIKDKLTASKKNPKETWRILNECIGRTSKNEKIEKILSNGNITLVPLEIANEFI